MCGSDNITLSGRHVSADSEDNTLEMDQVAYNKILSIEKFNE